MKIDASVPNAGPESQRFAEWQQRYEKYQQLRREFEERRARFQEQREVWREHHNVCKIMREDLERVNREHNQHRQLTRSPF